ncbi:MAG: alpha/beta fold hydrolase [Planctomycetota bacterium]
MPPRTGPSRRFWLAIAALYAALLVTSHLVQALSGLQRVPATETISRQAVQVSRTTHDGVLPREDPRSGSMTVAYLRWSPAETPTESRPPVLLLHGSPGSADNYSVLGPKLAAAGYEAIAVDLPGFGSSSARIPDYGNRAHAFALIEFLDALDIDRAHVVGWSNGGGITVELSVIAPERVASATLLGGTGSQFGEGSQSYWFEKAKYAVGYATLVALPEAFPHFGLLADRGSRHAFIRSFWDTDLRAIERALPEVTVPTLVLQGRNDFLVPDFAAEHHHELIPTSRLVVLPAGHFLPFMQADETTRWLVEHFSRHDMPGIDPLTNTVDLAPIEGTEGLAGLYQRFRGLLVRTPWWAEATVLGLLAWRFPWLAVLLAGLLVGGVRLDIGVATVGLLVGRMLHERAWGRPRRVFGLFLTLPIVLTFVQMGIATWLRELPAWLVVLLIPPLAIILRIITACARRVWTRRGRLRLGASVRRLVHHEWWSPCVFYLPLIPYLLWLSIRHRGVLVFACANPGIERGGGLVGESKLAILRALADDPSVLTSHAIPEGPISDRLAALDRAVENLSGYPVILKPDEGQRGAGVRLLRSREDGERAFLSGAPGLHIAQRYHPGPMEAGVLWARVPDADPPRGEIIGVTRKEFPEVTGDGRHTLRELILDHPRYRCQEHVFEARFLAIDELVPSNGERVRLAEAGNHCQGALFRDGADLITPELTAAIDRLSLGFEGADGGGFDFGRFDLRYTDDESLRRGEGFGVVELNGTTSESTNLYDPDRSTRWAYGVLFRQWRTLYALGAWRCARGSNRYGFLSLMRDLCRFYARDRGSTVSS